MASVVGLDAGFYCDGCLYEGMVPAPRSLRKDIRHISDADLEGIDAVVHLAELSNDPLGELNPAITYAINHHGTVELGPASCKQARVSHASCIRGPPVSMASALMITRRKNPYRNPQTAYAECKVLVET